MSAPKRQTSGERARELQRQMQRNHDIEMLTKIAKGMPHEHRDRPGILRAAEILCYEPLREERA